MAQSDSKVGGIPVQARLDAISDNDVGQKRILVVMPSIPLHGMERANIQIMNLLSRSGAKVLFVTESGWGHDVAAAVDEAGCDYTGIKLGRNLRRPRGVREAFTLGRYWLNVSRRIREIFVSFKPTHLYLTNLSFFLFALPLAGGKGARTIFRLPNPPSPELAGWRRLLSQCLWKYLVIPRCDLLVCNSEYSRNQLQKLGDSESHIKVIYNSRPRRKSGGLSDAPTLRPGRFNVVYLGRIQKSKGVDFLYQTAVLLVDRFPHVDFYLAGEYSWNNAFAESLVAKNADQGFDNRIVFLGHIEDTERLLKQSQLHVCPSTSPSESFPNVILEAKYAGLPSVGFDTAGIPEAIRHGSEGLICREKTAECLAENITQYILNPDLLKSHGNSARESLARHDEVAIQTEWVRALDC